MEDSPIVQPKSIEPIEQVGSPDAPPNADAFEGPVEKAASSEIAAVLDEEVKPLRMLAQICVDELADIKRHNNIFADAEIMAKNDVHELPEYRGAVQTIVHEEINNNSNATIDHLPATKQIGGNRERKRSRKSDHPRKKIKNRNYLDHDSDVPLDTIELDDTDTDVESIEVKPAEVVMEVEKMCEMADIQPVDGDAELGRTDAEANVEPEEVYNGPEIETIYIAETDTEPEAIDTENELLSTEVDSEPEEMPERSPPPGGKIETERIVIELERSEAAAEQSDDYDEPVNSEAEHIQIKPVNSEAEHIQIVDEPTDDDAEMSPHEPEHVAVDTANIAIDAANTATDADSVEEQRPIPSQLEEGELAADSAEAIRHDPEPLRVLCRKTLDRQSVIVTYDVPTLKCLCEHSLALAGINVLPICYVNDSDGGEYHAENESDSHSPRNVYLCLDSEFDETELANLFNGSANYEEAILSADETSNGSSTQMLMASDNVSLIEQCVALENILASPSYDRMEQADTGESSHDVDGHTIYDDEHFHSMIGRQEIVTNNVSSLKAVKKRLQTKYVNPLNIYKMLVMRGILKKYVIYGHQVVRRKRIINRKLREKLRQLAEKRLRAMQKPKAIMTRRRSMRLVEKRKEMEATRRKFEFMSEKEKLSGRDKVREKPKKSDKLRTEELVRECRNDQAVKCLKIKLVMHDNGLKCERADSNEKDAKLERVDKDEKAGKPNDEKMAKSDRNEKISKIAKYEKVAKAEKSDKIDKIDRFELNFTIPSTNKPAKNAEVTKTVKSAETGTSKVVKSVGPFSAKVEKRRKTESKEKPAKAINKDEPNKGGKPVKGDQPPKTTNGEKVRKPERSKTPTIAASRASPAEPQPPQTKAAEPKADATKPADGNLDNCHLMELIAKKHVLQRKISSSAKPSVRKGKPGDTYCYDEDREIDQMLNSFVEGGVDRRTGQLSHPSSRHNSPTATKAAATKRPLSPDVMAAKAVQERQAMRPAKIQKRSFSVSARGVHDGEHRKYNYMDMFNRQMEKYNFGATDAQHRQQSPNVPDMPAKAPVKRTISFKEYIAQRPTLAKQESCPAPTKRPTPPHHPLPDIVGSPSPKRFMADTNAADKRIGSLLRDFTIPLVTARPKLASPAAPPVAEVKRVSPIRINLETLRVSPKISSPPVVGDPRLRDAKSQVNLVTSTQTPLNTIQLKLPSPAVRRSPDMPKHTHTRRLSF